MSWAARTQTPPDPSATELTGRLAALRFCWENGDGSCSVVGDLASGAVVRGTVEARGDLAPGGTYRLLGQWREHPTHGWQFVFDSAFAETPGDPEGVCDYLARHAEGVGPVTAARLVAAYGADAARVLAEEPARVSGDELMSADAAALASASLLRVYGDPALRAAHQELCSLLRGHGFYAKAVKSALRRWRKEAPARVRRDPFLLMTRGLPGCGFLKCDRLYCALGKPPRRLKRQALAAWYALGCLDGDTWTTARKALAAVREQIGGTQPREQRACALLCRAMLAQTRTDERGQVWIADRYKAMSERLVAIKVRQLARSGPCWPAVEGGPFDRLSDHQRAELVKALTSPVALLTGTPGTGKTYVAAALIEMLLELHGEEKVAVCAPTGKAAVRITEKLAEAGLSIKATTIHRLLSVCPADNADGMGFAHGPDDPLPHRYVIVDETSMVDAGLMACLLAACAAGTHLLFVGDTHQLPPVGHGAPLRDMIAAGLSRAELTEVRRNAGRIVTACKEIKDGKVPNLTADLTAWPDANLIQVPWGKARSPGKADELLREKLDHLLDWLGSLPNFPNIKHFDLIDHVQVIVARNATRQGLNKHLQQRLNAAGEKGPAGPYRTGDKVICLRNGFVARADDRNHEQVYVCNGDIGRVKGFRGRQMMVQLQAPSRLVAVPLTKRGEDEQRAHAEATGGDGEAAVASSWDLAFAVTCHKYQGSEVPVAIVLAEGAGRLGSREWIYTAVSRAKSLCLLVADRQEMTRYVRNVTLPDRKTFLKQLITGELKP